MTTAAPHAATRLLTILLAALVVSATLAVAPAQAAARTRTTPELEAEAIVLALHHEARKDPSRFGYALPAVAPVTGWTDIRDVARSWSDRQAAELRMFHNPDFSKQLCCWSTVGENVAFITMSNLDDATVDAASRRIFQAWMDSPGHRDNILSGTYDQMGLGISITPSGSGYAMYLTANFRKVTGTAPGTSYGAPAAAPAPYDTAACPEGSFPRVVFGDTASGTHAGAIDCMTWWGVITTTDAVDGIFGQSDLANRGFMAAVIDRLASAAGEPLPAATRDHFDDDDGHRYEAAINRVVSAGIAGGFTDGTFRPNANLSRAQMATFLANTYRDWFELGDPALSDHFGDDDGNVHEERINLVAQVGIARGTAAGQFSPGSNLSRGQLASFAARTADILVGAGVPLPS
ncbi:MAG: S-layer homology domain-containing protein [Actinobacteria bacterium]|nr:S-layer homology domain-containing protein [Actinomycetota bacterium]